MNCCNMDLYKTHDYISNNFSILYIKRLGRQELLQGRANTCLHGSHFGTFGRIRMEASAPLNSSSISHPIPSFSSSTNFFHFHQLIEEGHVRPIFRKKTRTRNCSFSDQYLRTGTSRNENHFAL